MERIRVDSTFSNAGGYIVAFVAHRETENYLTTHAVVVWDTGRISTEQLGDLWASVIPGTPVPTTERKGGE